MKKTYTIVTFLLVSMLFSCGYSLSDLNQITAKDIKCSINQSKADQYYEKYGKNNSRISGSEPLKQQAFQKLSNVPEEYLEFVINKYKIPISLASSGGGVTWLQNYGNTIYPTSLESGIYVLAHEWGHASEGWHWDKYPSNFSKELAEISALIAQKYQNTVSWYLRSYAGSYQWSRDRETFAELFDTWYCSTAAREKVKEGMPEVYQFAQKYLQPAEGFDDVSSKKMENINIFFRANKIYFGNNKNYSNISYCIGNSSDKECSNKISTSSFSNKSGKKNLFVSDNLDQKNISSFTVFVYGDDSLVRKVSISK